MLTKKQRDAAHDVIRRIEHAISEHPMDSTVKNTLVDAEHLIDSLLDAAEGTDNA